MTARVTLSQVRASNPTWFSPENKRFFNDISYRVLHTKTGDPCLVQQTYAWSDMLGKPRREHYRIRPIGPDLSLGSLHDYEFPTLEAVKDWLKEN